MCSIVPGSLTVIVSECDPVTQTYSISGTIQIYNSSTLQGLIAFGTACGLGGTSPYVVNGPFSSGTITIPYTITGIIPTGPLGCIVSADIYNTSTGTSILCDSAELEFIAAEPCFTSFLYYEFTNCCTGDVLSFSPGDDKFFITIDEGTYLYTGPNYQGLESNTCYTVSNAFTNDPVFFGNLPLVPANSTANYTEAIDCNDTLVCPGCDVPCYRVYSCDGGVPPFNTYTDLSDYLGQFVELSLVEEPSLGCFYVQLVTTGTCADSVEVEIVSETCNCECLCYTVVGSAKDIYWVDCNNSLHNTTLSLPEFQICSKIYPVIEGEVAGTIPVVNIGLPCINDECQTGCYKLEDLCDGLLDPIYTNKVSLGVYAILGQIVVLDGYPDTCWTVTEVAECDCAIDVTVLQVYEDCITCKNPSKYKLTNCDNSNLIVYTSSDLSAYVGQVIIREDCPGCWYVEEIENIPSDTIVTVTIAYIDCIECAREYYELTDCTGFKDPIITYTDLSQYLGSVIKIKYCPETCWTVNATNVPTNAGIVIPEVEYVDCPECLLTFPCICTTVRNDSTTSKEYRYYDCNLDVQFFTLAAGAKSDRFCMRVWAEYYPETDYIETFGDCTETTTDVWDCPAIIYPRRSIEPGYSTPVCSTEKYEKISCRSADVYYKQVLYLRYGITDCCPDENDKWVIKKELIDMDALRDPNYECTVVNSCCPSTPSCGYSPCNCSQPITTCNSQ
jgi:hypothetical protein